VIERRQVHRVWYDGLLLLRQYVLKICRWSDRFKQFKQLVQARQPGNKENGIETSSIRPLNAL
jgi:hypothetical protein